MGVREGPLEKNGVVGVVGDKSGYHSEHVHNTLHTCMKISNIK